MPGMHTPRLTRRAGLSRAVASLAAFIALPTLAAPRSTPLAPMTDGPFYPPARWRERWPDWDADLTVVRRGGREHRARGEWLDLQAQVVDSDGRALDNAEVEIWQCDAGGVYHHVGSASRGADPNFQGYGKANVAADGAFRFRTIRPVAYPGRTPHIHAIAKGQGVSLTTQLYIDGEPQNERDGLFRSIRDPQQRASVLMKFRPAPELEASALYAESRIVLKA